MKTLKVKRNWFKESGQRLDASYHLSDGPITKLILKNSPYHLTTLLKETEAIFKGNIFKRVYVDNPNTGHPFMTASDMMKSDLNSGKFVSKKYTNVANLMVDENWILTSRSGTLGNTIYTNKGFKKFLVTDDLIRIVPNNNKIKGGFLYAYLTSKYGNGLLVQSSYGGVVKHIEPHHIEELPIPVFPEIKQREIDSLITEASQLRFESDKILSEAIDYFDSNFNEEKFKKTFKKRINSLRFSFAAYNNNPEAEDIEKLIKRNGNKLSELASDCFSPPMFKHIYLKNDNGHPFLTGSELTKYRKEFYRWLSPRGVKDINDYKVKKGTLLLYKSGTTEGGILGNVFIADDILNNVCLSDHVIRITFDDIKTSYWAFAFLKSSAGVKLLQKTATGSMIPFITPPRLLDLYIPKPSDKFDWVSEKVTSYMKKSVESQMKEKKAIELVEKEIEQWQK